MDYKLPKDLEKSTGITLSVGPDGVITFTNKSKGPKQSSLTPRQKAAFLQSQRPEMAERELDEESVRKLNEVHMLINMASDAVATFSPEYRDIYDQSGQDEKDVRDMIEELYKDLDDVSRDIGNSKQLNEQYEIVTDLESKLDMFTDTDTINFLKGPPKTKPKQNIKEEVIGKLKKVFGDTDD